MQRTRRQTLLLVAAVTGLLGWLVLRVLEGQDVRLPPVPWLVVAVLVVISAVVLVMGWAVRQFLQGKRPTLNPIRAARTAVLAKASSYTGALLAGWYAAQVLLVVRDLGFASQRARAISAGCAVLAAVLLALVGLVVEGFCRVPPAPPDAAERGVAGSGDPAAA